VDADINDMIGQQFHSLQFDRRTVLEGNILARDHSRLPEAFDKWAAALRSNPHDTMLLGRLYSLAVNAATFMNVGNVKAAAHCYEAMIAIRPTDAAAIEEYGKCQLMLGDRKVAEQAKMGRPVYAYVLALVSRMPNPPPAARLDEETRKKYLDGCRDKIKKLANEKNNSMAWYLLSLENNDRDLLHRAADAGNVQAMNAWGTYLVTRAVAETADTNEVNRILGVAHDYFKSAAGQAKMKDLATREETSLAL